MAGKDVINNDFIDALYKIDIKVVFIANFIFAILVVTFLKTQFKNDVTFPFSFRISLF